MSGEKSVTLQKSPTLSEIIINNELPWVQLIESQLLDIPRPVMPLVLNGKRLVLFRNDGGMLGLIGRNCPHRGADLCYGRLEDNGLRCPFHGWHFNYIGQCLEQPAEPKGSQMYKAIKIPTIPVAERAGIVWAHWKERYGFDEAVNTAT
ncbi:MAG: Rieske 2Fe-2S domain-containing protein [Aestuariivita sp.]|nr:Rieske 2Fe-2S domain-containing protein [Aestuariivita sp.]